MKHTNIHTQFELHMSTLSSGAHHAYTPPPMRQGQQKGVERIHAIAR